MPSPIHNTFNQNNQFPITTSKIEQKSSPISQKNSFWSPAKIGIAAGAAFSTVATGLGYLTYLNLSNKNIAIDSPFNGTISKVFAGLIVGVGLRYAMEKKNSATTKEPLKNLSEEPPTDNVEKTNQLKSSQEKSLTPEESIKYWWNLSLNSGYERYENFTLNSVQAEKLYYIFKNIEKEFNDSKTKVINVPLLETKKEGENFLSVKFKTSGSITTEIEGESFPFTRGQLLSLFGGFILSMDTTFFAFNRARINFQIFKNINGNMNDFELNLTPLSIYTREGVQIGPKNRSIYGELIDNSPKGSEWKTGIDGVCRLVKENKSKDLPSSTQSNTPENKSNDIKEIEYPSTSALTW